MSKLISVRIIPRAGSNKIEQTAEDAYKVWVTSPAQDGKANAHLVKLFAKYFSVAKSSVQIIKGLASRNKLVKIGIFLIAFLTASLPAFLYAKQTAKPVEAVRSADKLEITIGEDIKYSLKISNDKDITVSYPEEGFGLDDFEIKDYGITGPLEKKGRVVYSQNYLISAFTLGEFTIGPLTVNYSDANGKTGRITLDAIKVTVKPVIRRKDDKDDIRGIKPQAAFSPAIRKILIVLLALIILAAVAFAVYYYLFAKRKRSCEQVDYSKSAEEIALEALEKLRKSSLIEDGRIKDYCDGLSDIIREYIYGRWEIDALEKTTWELYQDLRANKIERNHVDRLYAFLKECDLVKFAKYTPLKDALEKVTGEAYKIVEDTTPATEVAKNQ